MKDTEKQELLAKIQPPQLVCGRCGEPVSGNTPLCVDCMSGDELAAALEKSREAMDKKRAGWKRRVA